LSRSPLIVHVEEPETGAAWDYVFEAGPVIVGRGDDAPLQIARPFVSLHHGTFDFDDVNVTYVDLESRNGTLVDGVARGSDRPVPVTEASEIRIGKVRLRVSRTAPVSGVAEERPNPFAPKKGAAGAVKGTDALPREDVERIRREILARKAEPPPPAPPVGPPAPLTPAPLEKTVPVPLLQSRPVMPPPAVPPEAPPVVTPYAAGGTAGAPRPSRDTPVRRTTRSRPTSGGAVARPAARAVKQRPWWPYVLMAVVFVAGLAAVAIVVASGGEEEEVVRRRPRPENPRVPPTTTPPLVDPVKPAAAVEPEREWLIVDPPAPKRDPPTLPRKPEPSRAKAAAPPPPARPARSPILE
jgi:predicted component of type VI protein secretion system